jgi:hypothetical protein
MGVTTTSQKVLASGDRLSGNCENELASPALVDVLGKFLPRIAFANMA